MKVGVAAWATDRGVGVADLARGVEEAGFESLFLTGHTHVPVSRRDLMDGTRPGEDARLLDQFTALGVAAACTTRLKLGTGICVVPQYDPIVLAKQVATIDHLSGGRFVFGVGAGWLVEELRNHGVDPSRRWDLMGEQILAMKAIWRDEEAEFHGELVDFDPIWSWPKPVQKPHPPVLVGGSSTPSLRLAATHGDGWAPVVADAAEFARERARWQTLCDEVGGSAREVTAFVEDLDDALFAALAEFDVARTVVLAPRDNPATLRTFLDGTLALADRGGLPIGR
ncbi:MAG TPA: LLM class F420-dependent oxidoreductase [Gaiellales bacterium]